MRVMRSEVRVLAAGCVVAGLLVAAVPAAADPTVVPGGVTFCGLAGDVASQTGYGYPPECLADPYAPAPVVAGPVGSPPAIAGAPDATGRNQFTALEAFVGTMTDVLRSTG